MATSAMSAVIHHLRKAALGRNGGELTDEQLLENFIDQQDEAAFEALVRRHGPMVLGVCRRVIGHVQDAEDAFQATFLILARKAAALAHRDLVGNWLYGVAYRTALEARSRSARRCAREKQVTDMPHPTVESETLGQEFQPLLDQELHRLPDKYRVPLVLCELEGRTRKDVAQQLQIPEGTLSSRLATARRTLAERLTRRGLAISGGALAALLSQEALAVSVPAPLLNATVRAAALAAVAPTGVTGLVSANVASLMEAVLSPAWSSKLKIVMGAILVVGTFIGARAAITYQVLAVEQEASVVQPVEHPEAARAATDPSMILKTERFDRDPGWEGFNNRVVPQRIPTVTQGFGYSPTNFAGATKGEIGGQVTRSTTPAYYADRIAVKTLNDRLSASGTFALTATSGNSAVFFGWFNAEQPGGGRPMNSLGLYLDGEKDRDGQGARLAVRLIAGTNRSCGTYVTPASAVRPRPTPIRTDGTRYTWTLDYDPATNGGNGRFQFTVQGDGAEPEDFEGRVFVVDLPAGFKQQGATFDRFGLMNLMNPGQAMTIYFDDLRYDGKTEDFANDPGWEESGNHATFPDPVQAGAHDFGFSATNFAGGAPGEIGGTFWRAGTGYGYYADRVGPLTLADRLEARGRVVLKVAAPNSDMYLGWFSSTAKDKPPVEAGHFLGIHLGGPSRVGHYFRPAYTTASGTRGEPKTGPVLIPDRVCDWTLLYHPTADGGVGALRVTLGQESVTLPLRKGRRTKEACFDRFGLFTSSHGGSLMKVYFDDLNYTQGTGVKAATRR